mmetsp:Transcript_65473/g.142801  ORF Transcript_65473/g.142801 Transcript_65473/m.142801 type:complete len:209 (+) Transcript_65473:596-1222(+)
MVVASIVAAVIASAAVVAAASVVAVGGAVVATLGGAAIVGIPLVAPVVAFTTTGESVAAPVRALAVVAPSIEVAIAAFATVLAAVLAVLALASRSRDANVDGISSVLAELVDLVEDLQCCLRSLDCLVDNKTTLLHFPCVFGLATLLQDVHVHHSTIGAEDHAHLILTDVAWQPPHEELLLILRHALRVRPASTPDLERCGQPEAPPL